MFCCIDLLKMFSFKNKLRGDNVIYMVIKNVLNGFNFRMLFLVSFLILFRTLIIGSTTVLVFFVFFFQSLQDSDGDGEFWNCLVCIFLNYLVLNKCECCEMFRMNVFFFLQVACDTFVYSNFVIVIIDDGVYLFY